MSVLNSIDTMLASAQANGLLVRSLFDSLPSTTTAATTTSGYTSHQRFPTPFTIPSLGAGITGVVFPNIRILDSLSSTPRGVMCGLETLLGTATANGGTGIFADGSVMPTKTVRGTSAATATQQVFAVVTTVMVGAGSYTLTITYTNQSGVGGKTATLTIPNVAIVNSAFDITPHLASGDSGMQDVTGITLTGTTGAIKIYGVLTLQSVLGNAQNSVSSISMPPMTFPTQMWSAIAGEVMAFYSYGSASSTGQIIAMIVGVADS